MNILSHFNEFLTKKVTESANIYMGNVCNCLNTSPFNFNCYQTFIEELDKFTSNLTIDAYQHYILLLDEDFMRSPARKLSYDSKGFLTKLLLTKFGWIKFKRRRYVSKETGKTYMHVDRLLELTKYSRIDSFVIADLCEEAASTSYANAGRLVSKTIGSKIKYDDDINKNILSRTTVRNIVLKATEVLKEPINEHVKEIKELNILLDEKYIPSQFNNGKDFMVKAAVIYESYKKEYKSRTRLVGKKVFASTKDDLLPTVMDYIYYHYNTDELKYINVMGDGALWIKAFANDSSLKYHKKLKVRYGLDHFHLAQAIQIITTNKYKDIHGKFIFRYIISDKKEYFIKVCDSLARLNIHRAEKIGQKKEYILNNWKAIQTSFHQIKYKCCMESNISHIFADLFTARPKAYSEKGLDALLKIRLLKTNGYDFKKIYFDSLKKLQKENKDKAITEKHLVKNISKRFNDSFYASVPAMHESDSIGLSLKDMINGGIKI